MTNKLDPEVMQARYADAVAQYGKLRGQRHGEVSALSVAVASYADIAEQPLVKKATQASKLFLIAFAFIVPNLLMIYIAL